VHHVPGQADFRQDLRRVDSLKGEVVNGEHRRNAADDGVVREEHLLVRGHEAGLPIVCVDDRGPPAAQAHVLEGGTAQDCEPSGVVGVVSVARPVEPFAIEVLRGVDEHRLDPRANPLMPVSDALQPRSHRKRGAVRAGRPAAPAVRPDAAVSRQDDGDGMPKPGERLRQRSDDFGEPAGGGERVGL
jgi:hypothetical protein